MVKLDYVYDLVNDSPASATPVEANFNRTEQFINQEMLNRDGSVAMTAQLRLATDPVNALDAAPKQYVDGIMPIGTMMMFGGASAPTGGQWLLCNGAVLQQSAYPDLFAVIGRTYTQPATPTGSFCLPDLAGRIPIGVSSSDVLGDRKGTRDAVVISHSHTMTHTHASVSTGTDSPDHAHNGVDHTHGNTGGQSANHTHVMGDANQIFRINSVAPNFYMGTAGVNSLPTEIIPLNAFTTGGASNDHVHGTGGADRSLTTSGATARHAHTVPALTFTGDTAVYGAPSANANMPPVIVVSFIIKAT
jgi:microcystin-dependent protein